MDTESGFDKYGRISDPEILVEPNKNGHVRYYGFSDYYVDQNGILQVRPGRNNRRTRRSDWATYEDYKEAEIWLNGRMVMEQGGKLYWVIPNQDLWMASWFDPNAKGISYNIYDKFALTYYVFRCGEFKTKHAYYSEYDRYRPHFTTVKTYGDHWEPVENPYSFRQRGELSSEEVKAFRSFKEKIRQDILAYTKGR